MKSLYTLAYMHTSLTMTWLEAWDAGERPELTRAADIDTWRVYVAKIPSIFTPQHSIFTPRPFNE